MKKLLAIFLLLAPSLGFAQGTLLQGGPIASGHVPMYVSSGSSQAVVRDSGPAGGGAVGLGLSELLMVKRGQGSPPYVNGGTGPLGTSNCMYDGPTTSAAGYHYLCFDPNAQGGALITYGAGGGALALPFNINVNGTIVPFPGAGLPSITINSTVILGGTNGYFLYNNAGVVANFNLFGAANTWTQPQTVTAPVSASLYKIGADVILTHPITNGSSVGLTGTNITLGLLAGAAIAPIPTTNYLTLLGYAAGTSITTADHITAVGAFALEKYTVSTATPGNQPSLTAIGIDSMRNFTTGSGNTAVGEHTMVTNTTISDSVAVGNGAMFNSGGIRNTALGVSAMLGAFPAVNYLSGNDNVAVGFSSLASIGTTSSTNTAVGSYSLTGASLAQANTAVGYSACATVTTGSFNICIGQAAGGTTLATGGQNILIGLGADTPTASTSSYLNIGGWLYGAAANFVRIKGSSGTKPPTVLSGTSGSVGADDSAIVVFASGTFTLTLPSAALYPGRWLILKSIVNEIVNSAGTNVGPLAGGAVGTAILSATAGKWAQMQSNGTYWEIMAAN